MFYPMLFFLRYFVLNIYINYIETINLKILYKYFKIKKIRKYFKIIEKYCRSKLRTFKLLKSMIKKMEKNNGNK